MRSIVLRALAVPKGPEAADLMNNIRQAIEPIDVAGLTLPNTRNWYPVNADDLLRCCAKVEATRDEIMALLERCGFYAAHTS